MLPPFLMLQPLTAHWREVALIYLFICYSFLLKYQLLNIRNDGLPFFMYMHKLHSESSTSMYWMESYIANEKYFHIELIFAPAILDWFSFPLLTNKHKFSSLMQCRLLFYGFVNCVQALTFWRPQGRICFLLM